MGTEKTPLSNRNQSDTQPNVDDDNDDDECQDEVVWLHGPLQGFKVVDGKPLVLVPWYPTWEPPDEYSKEEVQRVKGRYGSQTPRKRRGRPPSRKLGGTSNVSLHMFTASVPDWA
jgi:hypothetical protein